MAINHPGQFERVIVSVLRVGGGDRSALRSVNDNNAALQGATFFSGRLLNLRLR